MKRNLIWSDYKNEIKMGKFWSFLLYLLFFIIFTPMILFFLYNAFFASLDSLKPLIARIFIRISFGIGALWIINAILIGLFNKPIKIYKEGIDLGTVGSLGFLMFIRKNKFVEWNNIKNIGLKHDRHLNLRITTVDSKTYYCPLGDEKRSYDKIAESIKRIGKESKINSDT